MKRINDKVRDFVEVRSFKPLVDLLSDPAETLNQYHFTDSTAGLMVQWLNSISTSEKTGTCRAIAGHRGVGKSHFLAVLGAIASNPELRSKIANGHVATGAQALLRRHYPVVNVRRGLSETLESELAAAIEIAFHRERFAVGTSIESMLLDAKSRSNGLPLVIIVDTAFDRGGEVRRNDGKKLGEIALRCISEGIFLGLALDDDIAGADGDNVAISNCFTIDYLEQEHLFNVINSQIFAKTGRKQAELQAIYEHIRSSVPGFSWSEPRFVSLYPIHPVIFEIAPFVRRFAANFSILRFASVSGEKILGRPADSLIGLDELFDDVESELRKNTELEPAFVTYDSIRIDLIDRMPAQDRLRRKMILKALFLHSLDGRGASSDTLTQSLFLVEPNEGAGSSTAELLDAFAQTAPRGISKVRTEGDSNFFAFAFGIDEFEAELERRAKELPESLLSATLLNEVSKLFPEFGLESADRNGRKSVPVQIEWRNSIRPGVLVFGDSRAIDQNDNKDPNIEWELYFDVDLQGVDLCPDAYPARIGWKTDVLRADEVRSLFFHSIIQNDPDLRNKFGEHYAISAQAYGDAVRAIAQRVAVSDARLVIDGFDYNFTDAAKEARDLGSIMSIMLEPIFEARFPLHPNFEALLTAEVLDEFVSMVYGGVLEPMSDSAVLARTIGIPLGIVVSEGNSICKANKDELSAIIFIASVLEIVNQESSETTSIETVAEKLRQAPYGLTLEARMLLLAAMVSNGLVELVTAQGHRVNRRSLDLKINWQEIVGLASPRSAKYSKDIVTEWAKILTSNPTIDSLENPENRRVVLAAFVEFSNRWDKINSPTQSDRGAEYLMPSRIARRSNRVRANYERVIQDVENALLGTVELEECIGNISQAFGEQSDAFFTTGEYALSLDRYYDRFSERESIKEYVARACPTGDSEVEFARNEVRTAIVSFETDLTDNGKREIVYAFDRFRKKYVEAYVTEHSMANESIRNDQGREALMSTIEWQRFSQLMAWEPFRIKYFPLVRRIRRDLIRSSCDMDPTAFLEEDPVCACDYRIGDLSELVFARSNFDKAINDGLDCFNNEVSKYSDLFRNELTRISSGPHPVSKTDSREIDKFMSGSQNVMGLSDLQFEILLRILSDQSNEEI